MTLVRDFFRKRRVARHIRQAGPFFDYHGLRVHCPVDADVSMANALLRQKYETEEAGFVQAYLPADRPVIELGGSLGIVSALVGSRLAPGVPHLIVEANPDLLGICAENAVAGGPRDATEVRGAAVHYGAAEVSFTIEANPHVSRLSGNSEIEAPGARRVTVPTVTLLALHESLGQPDGYSLICDIEGAEIDVIDHDADAVRAAGLIILETHPGSYGGGEAEAARLIERVCSLGFTVLDRSGAVVALRRSV